MTQDKLVSLIRDYKPNKARLAVRKGELDRLTHRIMQEIRKAAENQSMTGISMDGMPHGNIITRRVEEIAINAMDGKLPDNVRRWIGECKYAQKEVDNLQHLVDTVDNAMSALNRRETTIITQHIVEDRSWAELSTQTVKLFGKAVSTQTMKRWQNEALCKMLQVVGVSA